MKRSSQFSLSRRQFRFERFLELLREKKVQNQNPEKVKPVEDFIAASKNILCSKKLVLISSAEFFYLVRSGVADNNDDH